LKPGKLISHLNPKLCFKVHLRQCKPIGYFVEISGHTDDVGSASSNQTLSQRRADSVRFWLISKGIQPDRIIAKGYGEEFQEFPMMLLN